MKKKIGIILAVVATAVIGIVSLVGCSPSVTNLKVQITQADALTEVQANTADVAIVDGVMAGYNLSTGTAYNRLQIYDLEGFNPEVEYYGVGAKLENQKLINYINKRLYDLKDTKYVEFLKKYGIENRKVDFTEPTGDYTGWKDCLKNNEIVIGFTLAAPYGMGTEANPEGFDFDLAREVFKDDNITIKGKLITWTEKIELLKSNMIDLVWNGMTILDEFTGKIAVSVPYMENQQVIVSSKKNADKFKTVEDLKGCVIVAERGSAGRDEAMRIFNKIDKEVFAEWLEKSENAANKARWEEIK